MTRYNKALAAIVAAAVGVLGEAVTDQTAGGVIVTREEWMNAVIVAVVAGIGVFFAPANTPAPPAE